MPSNPLILWCALLFLTSIFSNIRVFSNELALLIRFSSVAHVQLFATSWTAAHQASLSITNSGARWNSCPSSQWCHPTISSSVVPFSFCLQSSPSWGSFQMSQLFASGGYSIGASASVLPMNIQGWFPLGLTGLISLLSKGLSRVFFNTTVQKYQLFGAQLYGPTLTSIHNYWKNHSFDCTDLCWQSNVSAFEYAV